MTDASPRVRRAAQARAVLWAARHRLMIKTGAEHARKPRSGSARLAADAVFDLGDLRGQVIVKAAQHTQFSELITVSLEGAQGMGHGAGRLGDDGSVAGIGLGLPGVQVGDAPHRQSRQAAHRNALTAGHGHGQGTDGGGLIHHQQQLSVGTQSGDHRAQLIFVIGQGLVIQAPA